MKTPASRKPKQPKQPKDNLPAWPRKVQPGRTIVSVYKRLTPSGNTAFMVVNYADGKRRFDSYADEAQALEAAETLANRLDKRDFAAANLTQDQALEYTNAVGRLQPFGVTVDAGTAALAEALKIVGDLSNLGAAVRFYAAKHKQTTKRAVADVVADLIKVKTSRGGSARYLKDLRLRLGRFAQDCKRDVCNVTTTDIQDWLDGLKLGQQSYKNYATVLRTLFEFAVARGFAAHNPVEGVERVKVRGSEVEIFTPLEIGRLLESARANFPDFLPCIAIGAFAGLRSAEIERLEWKDIDLTARHIVIGRDKAKTASRRIIPLAENLAGWLADYANHSGKVWRGTSPGFYKAERDTAAATAVDADEANGINAQKPVEWKGNGLRHSYASYRFALIGDAGRVAGECGNSAAVIHRHYRELVKPKDAEAWFNIKPADAPANVLPLTSAASAQA